MEGDPKPEKPAPPMVAIPHTDTVDPVKALLPGEKLVLMMFTKPVRVIERGFTILFKPGPQQVPEGLVDHWYVKANGGKRYEAPAAAAPSLPFKTEEEEGDREEVEEKPSKPRKKK